MITGMNTEKEDFMKILFTTNSPAPYRVDFFNTLGRSVDLTVSFTARPENITHRAREWFHEDYENFRSVFLKKRLFSGKFAVYADILPLLKENWDCIILGSYSDPTTMLAIEYLRFRRVPFLMEMDGGLIKPDNRLKYRFKRHFISSANAWLSSGPFTTKYLTHYGADAERCYHYPFTSLWEADIQEGAKASPEAKAAARRKIGVTEEKMVLYAGQFVPRKGIDVLLKAAASFEPNVGVYIVGGGAEIPEEYLHIQKELSLRNVRFVGFKTKEALRDYYLAADVFVLPTREDVWGLVVNEALSFGLPVVSTERCVAAVELIRNGENGYIVPVDDHVALANAIRKALNGDAERFRQAALDSIRGYSIENMASRHLEILEAFRSD